MSLYAIHHELMNIKEQEIRQLPTSKELLVVGFSITNSRSLRKIKRLWAKQKEAVGNGKRTLGRTRLETTQLTSKDMGGEVALIDPDNINGPVLGSVNVRTPMGLYYDEVRKTLFTGSDHWIYGIKKRKIIKVLNNQYFNCIHGLAGSIDSKLWVVATGIDAVLKVDVDEPAQILSSWFATENGYDTSVNGGKRYIDRTINHQGVDDYSTPEHTTHINSVLEFTKDKLLGTLFHQGELIEIDVKTGRTRTILNGLREPHNVRKTSFGYIVSDTNGKRIIKLNASLQPVGEISGEFDWIQDAVELENKNIALADANNGRIVIVDNNSNIVQEYVFGENKKRVGVLLNIKVEDAINVFCT